MDIFEQQQFELAITVVRRALRKMDGTIQIYRIYSWCTLKNFGIDSWNFYKFIETIDLNSIAKAIQLHQCTDEEKMISEIPAVTEEEVNFFFFDKDWCGVTVGEFTNKIIDFVEYKMELLHKANAYRLGKEKEKFAPLIHEQIMKLHKGE